MILSSIIKLLIIYAIICIIVFLLQRRLIYYPYKNIKEPVDYGLVNFKSVTLKTADNIKINAWYNEPLDTSKPIIIMFHGNAGNLSHRTELFKQFTENNNLNILAIDYRGYGKSNGSPSESGFYEDARASINYVLEKGFKEKDIIFYGESIGCGVAVQMATEYKESKALILQSPFISLPKRAQEIYWYLPAKLLTIDRYNNLEKIKHIETPTLFFHGTKDNIVPDRHSEVLYNHSIATKKDRILLEGQNHNDLNIYTLVEQTKIFLKAL